MSGVRTIYRYWTAILFLAVLVQVGAAGYGAFYAAQKLGDQKGEDEHKMISEKVFDHGFDFHTGFGYIIFLGAVILLVLALAARLGRQQVLRVLALPVLVAIQIVLAWGGESTAIVGIFHPLVAFLIVGFTGSLAYAAWRRVRAIG